MYLAEFFSGIPADGDIPIWGVSVSASGLAQASELAAERAEKAGVTDGSYMIVRRQT